MAELIIILFVALGISFMCSVLEACLLSISFTDIAWISESKPGAARLWREFKDDIQKPIAVILIINTFAHTIGAALSGAKFDELYGHRWIAIFSIGFSLAMIQWTEILPKTLGVRYNRTVAVAMAYPIRFLITALTPLVALVELINRPFAGKVKGRGNIDALQELSVMTRFAALNNVISRDQEKILSRTLNISKMRVKDVMIRKADIRFLTTDMTLGDALIEAHLHHHTRLPLVKYGDFSEVLGYVNFKDIVSALQLNPEDPSLAGICRPILIFNENEGVNAIFNRLTRGYQHIALVKDDAGAVTGLITMEDIIEEIIGDIIDEYDILPSHLFQITRTRHVAGGGMTAATVREKFGVEMLEGVKTLSEWLIAQFGGLPRAGDRISRGGRMFLVKKIRRSSIFEVIIEEEAK
jgi:CBS domain containing-hemolysin-like protein